MTSNNDQIRMTRLMRQRQGDCVLFTEVEHSFVRPCDMSERQIEKALRRLAEYENTGLAPEEVGTLKRMCEDDKR